MMRESPVTPPLRHSRSVPCLTAPFFNRLRTAKAKNDGATGLAHTFNVFLLHTIRSVPVCSTHRCLTLPSSYERWCPVKKLSFASSLIHIIVSWQTHSRDLQTPLAGRGRESGKLGGWHLRATETMGVERGKRGGGAAEISAPK